MTTDTKDNTTNTPTAPTVPPATGGDTATKNTSVPSKTEETPQAKRDALRAKIEASERRIADRTVSDQTKDAMGTAKDYAKEHPLVVVGGAVALGLIIGMLTRPGRRIAHRAAIGTAGLAGTAAAETREAGRASKRKAIRLSDIVSDALAVYSAKLMDGAVDGVRAGQDALEDLGDGAARTARSLRRDADYLAGSTADNARHMSRRTKRRASRTARNIKGR